MWFQIRRAIGDFGVTIAIAIMVLIDLFVFDETYTQVCADNRKK